jgi:hypothetical protein
LEACTNPISSDPGSSDEEFDRDPPEELTINAPSATNDPLVTWSWVSGEGGVGYYRYRLNGAAWNYTEETSYTHPEALPEGPHTFEVGERDSSGNWSPTGSFITEVDLTPPDPPLLTAVGSEYLDSGGNPVPGVIVSSDTRPRWEWSPSGSGVSIFQLDTSGVDGAVPAGETDQRSYRPNAQLLSGSYTLRVRERDAARNWSPYAELTVLIDISVPQIQLLDDTGLPGDGLTKEDPPRWRITSGTGPSETDEYRWRIDGLAWSEFSGSSPVTLLPPTPWGDGSHTIEVQQQRADLTYSAGAAATVTIDATPPAPPQILGISSGTFKPDQSFTLTGESGSEREYSLDGGLSWLAYGGEVILDTNGLYQVTARQTDRAGNISGRSPTVTVTINKTPPALLTEPVTEVEFHQAVSGGVVTDTGGEPITARGVCWNTTGAPTVLDNCTVDGDGSGSFVSVIAGLDPSTSYTVRAYATNSIGTAYGTQLSFTTPAISIGDTYQGGIVFHLFAGGGGLIAALSDQSTGQRWSLDTTPTGATAAAIGTGAGNTGAITATVGVDSAAGICEELILNGFDDWFLPSEQEVYTMYQNLKLHGRGDLEDELYWSSTEIDALNARAVDLEDGSLDTQGKGEELRVRAIRAF